MLGWEVPMKFSTFWHKNAVIVLLLGVIALVACFYQTQKAGFHEDEVYTIASAVNPGNGLLTAYEENQMPEHGAPVWKTSQEVRDFVTLTPENYFNFHAIYRNQAMDNHPPLFYILVHFSALLLGGGFSKYTVFLINLPALLASCLVLLSILRRMGLERFRVPALLLYGLCMGTMSMVLLQRMYMLLTLFVLLYVDVCVELYRSGFTWNVRRWLRFGLICVGGFLTQYFFAVYAAFLFLVTLGAMFWQKRWRTGLGFALSHGLYGAVGIYLFPPCLDHLLHSDRGISNLSQGGYWDHLAEDLGHLAQAFSLPLALFVVAAVGVAALAVVAFRRSPGPRRFYLLLTFLPTLGFFLVTVKFASFQVLRYLMPMLPMLVLGVFLVAGLVWDFPYKTRVLTGVAAGLVLLGLATSTPNGLYPGYAAYLDAARTYHDVPFVVVNDNYFNHMKFLPEMMLYDHSLILNTTRGELEVLADDPLLEQEGRLVVSLPTYLDHSALLEQICQSTGFHQITTLCTSPDGPRDRQVKANVYLICQ